MLCSCSAKPARSSQAAHLGLQSVILPPPSHLASTSICCLSKGQTIADSPLLGEAYAVSPGSCNYARAVGASISDSCRSSGLSIVRQYTMIPMPALLSQKVLLQAGLYSLAATEDRMQSCSQEPRLTFSQGMRFNVSHGMTLTSGPVLPHKIRPSLMVSG